MAILDVGTGLLILGQAASGGGGGEGGNAGGVVGNGEFRVRFFDFDGTILKTQMCNAGEAAEAPAIPDHERLVFQEWNNDFDNITANLDVGAIYTTKSGKCEFDVWVNSQTPLIGDANQLANTAWLGISLVDGTVTVEWGDGETETLSTIGDTRLAHTYAAAGQYTILLSGTGGWKFLQNALSYDSNKQNTVVTAIRLANLPQITGQKDQIFQQCAICKTASFDTSTTILYARQLLGGAQNLRHFNFPRGLFTNFWTLERTRRMAHVTFSQGDTSIGYGCFGGGGLSDVTIPQSATEIGSDAFSSNTSMHRMTEVVIPPSVIKMTGSAFYAFNGVSCLERVVMKPTTPPAIQITPGHNTGGCFNTDGSLKEIIVPKGCAAAYKSATNWSTFADIIKEEE
jgi:hypothetical protein